MQAAHGTTQAFGGRSATLTRWLLALCLALGLALPPIASDAAPARGKSVPTKRISKKAGKKKTARPRVVRPVRVRQKAARPAVALATKPARPGPEADASEPAGRPAFAPGDVRNLLLAVPGKPVAVGLVIDAATGEVLLDLDSKRVVYPASVAKLFTTAATLRTLAPDKVLVTEVRAATPVGGTTATLSVIGAGDPTMGVADWAKLADAVKKAGITRVERLLIDATAIDDKLPKGFDEKNTDAAYRAPVGALQVDASTVAVAVRPGAVGQPPLVETSPAAGSAVVIRNEAVTVAGKKDAIGISTRANGRVTEVVVKGTLAASRKIVGSGRRRVAEASFFAAGVFRELLRARGIEVRGETTFAKAGADPLIASHTSPTVLKIATTTNKISHNGYAESLFKLVGLYRGGAPSTNDKAADGVRKALEGLDIHWQGVQIHNGSGLYHADKVTAQAVVDLLRGMARDPAGPNWRTTLAIGGKDGTLRGRLHHPATRGRVFAKTGTLDDVVGLAGYAEGGGKSLIFAFFYNDVRSHPSSFRAAHDRVLQRLLGE